LLTTIVAAAILVVMKATRNGKYLLSLAVDLESRLSTNDLRGFTAAQLEQAAERYRGLAAMQGAR
jgi:hypothetical protein